MSARPPRLSSVSACLRHAARLALAFLLCSAHVPAALAQSPTATLGGRVTDEREDVVPDANVVVTNAETGLRREARTDGGGHFSVAMLPPGRYTAVVTREGFATVEVVDVELRAGERRSLRLTLAPGPIAESVTVEDASLVETESTAVGARIQKELLENLPLSGRSLTSLLTLAPGVAQTRSTPNDPGQFSVNGQRTNANYFTVDGVSANFGTVRSRFFHNAASGNVPALSVLGGTSSLVSVDAVEEVAVLTSTYSSEYGRTPGGQISVVTRGGTNEFHGSVSEYFRNDALDATDWFVNSHPDLEKPPLRSNQFGGVLGGPILKNGTFFFVSYEGQRLRIGQVAIRQVPSLALRQSVPEWMRATANAFPVPNGPASRDGSAELAATFSEPWSLDATAVRVDHTIGERVTLFGRYNYAPSSFRQRGLNDASLSEVGYYTNDTHTLTFGSTQLLGSRVSNELRANYSSFRPSLHYVPDDFGGAVPLSDEELYPGPTTFSNTYRWVAVEPYAYFNAGTFATRLQRQTNIVDHLSVAAGPHQLKFGADYRRISSIPEDSVLELSTGLDLRRPPETPELAAGYLLFVSGTGVIAPHVFENLSLYAQDTWKATPRLTLTYGFRWELNFPPEDEALDGSFAVVGADDPATMRLAPAGTKRWNTSYGNVAPRLGGAFALSETRGRETVLRGGWGTFYDLGPGHARSLTYQTSLRDLAGTPYPLDAAGLEPAPLDPLVPPLGNVVIPIRAVDTNLALPRTYQASLTLEQALGLDQTLSISYVGAFGRKLLSNEYLENPNPTFAAVLVIRNGGESDYNALQVHFQRRHAAGLGVLASYTWSHAIDTLSSDQPFVHAREAEAPGLERASASFDVRHALSSAITYDLPTPGRGDVARALLGNWSTDWVIRARSAYPVEVVVLPRPNIVLGRLRPDVVPGEPVYLDDPSAPGGWRLNPEAFALPSGAQGNLPRNAVRGFAAWQLDMALRRRFALTEQIELQFRAEVFNLLNHPNFADPNPVLTSTTFGESTSTLASGLGGLNPAYQIGGPRAVQLALKLRF